MHRRSARLKEVEAQRHHLRGSEAVAVGNQDSGSVPMPRAALLGGLNKPLDLPLRSYHSRLRLPTVTIPLTLEGVCNRLATRARRQKGAQSGDRRGAGYSATPAPETQSTPQRLGHQPFRDGWAAVPTLGGAGGGQAAAFSQKSPGSGERVVLPVLGIGAKRRPLTAAVPKGRCPRPRCNPVEQPI